MTCLYLVYLKIDFITMLNMVSGCVESFFCPEAIARGVSLAPFLPDAKRHGICPGSNGAPGVSEPPSYLSKSPRSIRVISCIAISKRRTCNLTKRQTKTGLTVFYNRISQNVFFFNRLLIESF